MQFQSNQSEKLIKNSNKTEGGGTKNNWVYVELHFSLKNGFFKALKKYICTIQDFFLEKIKRNSYCMIVL